MQRKVILGEPDRTGTGCESEGGRVSHGGFVEPEWQWSDDLASLHVPSIGDMPPSSSWKKYPVNDDGDDDVGDGDGEDDEGMTALAGCVVSVFLASRPSLRTHLQKSIAQALRLRSTGAAQSHYS